MAPHRPNRWQTLSLSGQRLVRAGAVICLAAFVFGSVCMTIVAVIGAGEDPPKIFQQMGAASCVLFSVGIIVSLIGWLMTVTVEPDKPNIVAGERAALDLTESEPEEAPQSDADKPDPYASHHRRREF